MVMFTGLTPSESTRVGAIRSEGALIIALSPTLVGVLPTGREFHNAALETPCADALQIAVGAISQDAVNPICVIICLWGRRDRPFTRRVRFTGSKERERVRS